MCRPPTLLHLPSFRTLTHNCNTPWSESCCDEKEPNPDFATVGLTAGSQGFNGQGVVAEMNRIGMMVDLSHTSQRTMRDALRYSRAPVIFSHSGVYDLVQVERNVRTDIIQSLHQQGGLLMVFFYSNYTSTRGVNNASSIADHFDAIKAICQGSVDAIGVGRSDAAGRRRKRTRDERRAETMPEPAFRARDGKCSPSAFLSLFLSLSLLAFPSLAS